MAFVRTPQIDAALDLMEGTDAFVFVTGRAGTGKSTLLRHFRDLHPDVPVLAPTGVAALNIEGETIHRFFRFSPSITPRAAKRKGTAASDDALYRELDALIIDEISMTRADLLDCVDAFLRAARRDKRPFGGVRLIAIGDLYQLPPVVATYEREAFFGQYETAYFFSSDAFKELVRDQDIAFVELDKVFRQSDVDFIKLLNGIRDRSITAAGLTRLNERLAEEMIEGDDIVLTTTNAAAARINEERLAELPGDEEVYDGLVSKGFPEREAPIDISLRLKTGSRVMCVVNDMAGRFVNGSLGWVRGFNEKSVTVDLDSGRTVEVGEHTWTVYRSVYDADKGHLEQEKLGSFTQVPIKLAWAITIHKSQGKTFDRAVIDLGSGAFAAGQVYVALSRCRSLDGISLIRPVTLSQIHLDPAIGEFMDGLRQKKHLL